MSSRSSMAKMGKHIAELRKKKGYTQKKLGDILDISDKTISKWEKGVVAPDITILNELASALDITVEELLLGEEQIEQNTVEAIDVYSKITKRKLIKDFIALCLLIIIFIFFILRVEDYYSWHLNNLYFEGNISFTGYVLNNNKESKIVLDKFVINGLEEYDERLIDAKTIKIIVYEDDEIIYSIEREFDSPVNIEKIIKSYNVNFSIDRKIDYNRIHVNIDITDSNNSRKIYGSVF